MPDTATKTTEPAQKQKFRFNSKPKALFPGPRMSDPRKEREHEKIGGGFIVMRRGDDTGRVRPSLWPFEHPNADAAIAEADRKKAEYPDERFIVVQQIYKTE